MLLHSSSLCLLTPQTWAVKLLLAQGTNKCRLYKGHVFAGKQLAVRPVLDAERPDTHGWSLGASDGDHNVRLDAMDEGLTGLVVSLPTDKASPKVKIWPMTFC